MFCYNCGANLPEGSVCCPNCGVQLDASVPPTEEKTKIRALADTLNKGVDNAGGKGYAAIMSSLFVFPTLICIAHDLFDRDGRITWSAYAIGVAMCLWMFLVLPALKPKRPALTAGICLGVISLYMIFLAYVNYQSPVYVKYVLPICLMITCSSALLSVLISYKVIRDVHIGSAVIAQAGLLALGTEILFDIQRRGVIHLRWSVYTAIAAVSAIAILEAVNYANRLSRKN